jgi:hypothetical protein
VVAAIGLPALAGAYDAPTSPSQAYYVTGNWSDLVSFNGAAHSYAYVLGYTAAEGAPTDSSVLILDFGRQHYTVLSGGGRNWGICLALSDCSSATERDDSWVENVAEQFEAGYNDGHSAIADIVVGTNNDDDNYLCNNVTGQVDPNWQAAGAAWSSVVLTVEAVEPTLVITASGNDFESWTDALGAPQGTPTWQACGAGATNWYAGLETSTPVTNFDYGDEANVQPTPWTQDQVYQVAQGESGALVLPEIYCSGNAPEWVTLRDQYIMQFSGVTSENSGGTCGKLNGTPTPDYSWTESYNELNNALTNNATPYANDVFSDSSSLYLATPTEAATLTPTPTATPTP